MKTNYTNYKAEQLLEDDSISYLYFPEQLGFFCWMQYGVDKEKCPHLNFQKYGNG